MFSLNKKNEKKFFIIFLILSSLFIALRSFGTVDSDVLWHFKLGEDILKNGVTNLDIFSWQEGLYWISQQWLYDIYIFLVSNYLGNIGFVLSMTLVVFIVGYLFFKENKDYKSFLLLLIFYCFKLFFHKNGFNRPSLYSIIFITLIISNIFNKNDNKKLFKFFIYSIIISNIHGGCLITCLLILGIAFLFDFILYLLNKSDKQNLLYSFLSIIITFVGGLINPYLHKIYMVGMIGPGLKSAKYISEWESLKFDNAKDFLILIICLLVIISIASSCEFRNLDRKAFVTLGLSCAFLIAGIMSKRALLVTSIIFIIFGYKYFEDFVLKYFYQIKNLEKILNNKIMTSFINVFKDFAWVYLIVFFGILISTTNIKAEDNNFKNYIEQTSPYSYEIISYIKNNLDEDTHLLNFYNAGNYLLFNDCKVFIDSRQHPFTPEFGGNNSLDDLMLLHESKDAYLTLMKLCEFYNIEYIFWDNNIPFDSYIDIKEKFNDDWELVIEDSVEYEKKNKNYKVNQYLFKRK